MLLFEGWYHASRQAFPAPKAKFAKILDFRELAS
jgi:hypothetical protein